MLKKDVVIIGGGASGVACAINLKKKNKDLKITILEQNDKILKKVLKTGNGKCNIGNRNINSNHYNNFDFFKKWVESFNIDNYFKEIGLIIKEDEQGRLYPYSESASSVVDALRREVERLGIEVKTNFLVKKIEKKDNQYIIYGKEEIVTNVLVASCGSCAQSVTNGYELIKNLHHTITPLKSALVPIKVKENVKSLQGIKIKCLAKVEDSDFSRCGELLFKEDGISGILSLEMSRYVEENKKIILDLAPTLTLEKLEKFLTNQIEKKESLFDALSGILPKMLALLISKTSESIEKAVFTIKNFTLTVEDLYGFNNSQIVKGGVSLNEVKDTFESKLNKNLYIIGEILDIDGDCGGFNLYFAWLSAYVSSEMIIKENFTKC